MKTIDIEKVLDLQGAIDLLPVSMKDSFSYQKEKDGIRCVGPFFIRGRYTTLNEVRDFQDVFEFDVFAANEKLDGEEFKIVYDGYDFTLQNGVTITLHFTVYGIKDEEEDNVFEVDLPDQEIASIIADSALVDDNEKKQVNTSQNHSVNDLDTRMDTLIRNDKNDMDEEEQEEDKKIDLSMMEELFEEKDNVITSYSFVVVKKEDSYESIALRYKVDVEALKNVNGYKEIHEKSLIVLPYAK